MLMRMVTKLAAARLRALAAARSVTLAPLVSARNDNDDPRHHLNAIISMPAHVFDRGPQMITQLSGDRAQMSSRREN